MNITSLVENIGNNIVQFQPTIQGVVSAVLTTLFLRKKTNISEFEKMAAVLHGYTETCVISFIDIYKKVERNFPEAKSVRIEDRAMIGKAFVKIASKYGMVHVFWGQI